MSISKKESVGQRLKRLRQLHGWSQGDLAKIIDSPTTLNINRWENDKGLPQPGYRKKLAEAFGLSIEELFAPHDAQILDSEELEIEQEKKISTSIPHADHAMQLTPIFGRKQDITVIRDHLRDEKIRLITLTGAAGIGKTRLALAVLQDVKEHMPECETAYISLANLEKNSLILPIIAQELGIRSVADVTSLYEKLQPFMEKGVFVLCLDNLEHVINLEIDRKFPNKAILTDLIHNCPKLHILVTSRISLNMGYERNYPVKPLSTPPAYTYKLSELQSYSAAEFFLYHIELQGVVLAELDNKDNVRMIANICRQLDGLPLAIRTVARMFPKKLTLLEIQKRVTTIEALRLPNEDIEIQRQSTLFAAFDWSYELLSKDQQTVFRSFAIFTGECSLEAETTVSGKSKKVIWQLLDSGLVESEGKDGVTWYYLLRPIYEFARGKLEGLTDEEKNAQRKEVALFRRRHRDYYLQLAEASEAALRGAEQVAYLKHLEREWQNIHSAVKYTYDEELGEETFLRFIGGLWWYLYIIEWFTTCRDWLHVAREHCINEKYNHPLIWAKVLCAAGAVAYSLGEYGTETSKLLKESIALYMASGKKEEYAFALTILAQLKNKLGDIQEANGLLAESSQTYRDVDSVWGEAWAFLWIGNVHVQQGEFKLAVGEFFYSMTLFKKAGDEVFLASVHHQFGELAEKMGLFEDAKNLYAAGIGGYLRLDHIEHSNFKSKLASLCYRRGYVMTSLGDLNQAEEHFILSFHKFWEAGEPENVHICWLQLAKIALIQERWEEAARILGIAEGLVRTNQLAPTYISHLHSQKQKTEYETMISILRKQLGVEAFRTEWDKGLPAGLAAWIRPWKG